MSVFADADLKNSLTCSRNRGSPFASRPGPGAWLAEKGLVTTIFKHIQVYLQAVRRAALLKIYIVKLK